LKILISDSAYSDFEIIKEYYTEKNVPHIGEQFIGRKVPEFNIEKIRELIHGPFRVVYLREEQSIHVVRIWRSERLLKLENTPAEHM